MLQVVDRNSSTFDAVVVGSGATGGWAAKQLTEAGLRVAVARHQNNYLGIDRNRTDAWGILVLEVHMDWSANEKALWNDAREQGTEMIEAAGGKIVEMTGQYSVPGFGIHEMGTARMGNDPKSSVLNKFGQTHDVKNLFVTDGAAFVPSSCQNPTLTMMVITVRACEYALEQRRRGDLA